MLRVGAIEEQSAIYGPGLRFVIWVQGCTLACKGCWNKEFWPSTGGQSFGIDELLERINSTDDIEGITLLGGEPLQQAEPVLELIKRVKNSGLSVFLYSGYEREEINEIQKECVDSSDIVVLGRFIESQRNVQLRWRGSDNQVIEFPTQRYRGIEIEEYGECEVTIGDDGQITVLGYPDPELIELIKSMT